MLQRCGAVSTLAIIETYPVKNHYNTSRPRSIIVPTLFEKTYTKIRALQFLTNPWNMSLYL